MSSMADARSNPLGRVIVGLAGEPIWTKRIALAFRPRRSARDKQAFGA